MSVPTSFFGVSLALLSILTGSESLTTSILKPIRPIGDEVGLIFIPGAYIKADQYIKTARAIQETTELRIWVALTGSYGMNIPSSRQVKNAVKGAIKKLGKAGMKSKNYVGVGHGLGGHYLQDYAKKSNLKALILMGSTLSRKTVLRTYPIPVLTLAAELDGVTRITRIVDEYEKLTANKLSFFQGIYRSPIIFIEGANHARFASGELTAHLKAADLKANITEDQAHRMIGKYFDVFLTVTFSTVDTKINKAIDELSEAFVSSAKKFQPFLDVKNLDTDGLESMWTILAQDFFAHEYADRVAVSNEVLENPWFFGREPSTTFNDGSMIIATTSLIHAADKSDYVLTVMGMESPREIDMKLVAKNAIWKAFASQNDTALRSEPNTCKSLNDLALILALYASSESARERYLTQGRPIVIEEDVMRGANILWAPSPLQMWEDEAGLHVRSIALVTSRDHYCKVMSPYRAMEWVNVDSLRPKPLQG